MLSRLVKVTIIAAVLVIVIDSLPDIKRYLEIRDMLGDGRGMHEYGLAEGVLATVRSAPPAGRWPGSGSGSA